MAEMPGTLFLTYHVSTVRAEGVWLN